MRNKQNGSASIEFVMGFMAFWFMCMAWVEMSYMSYISAINDLAISEVSRSAKKGEERYLDIVDEVLYRDNSIWNTVISADNFRVSIQYLPTIEALESEKKGCPTPEGQRTRECGDEGNNALAIYRIDYDFHPIFSYVFSRSVNLSREMIVVQEYERSQFEI
ncbi:TadE/TadG family type IV pilus assembly protein [Aliivibrio fischeri]|uniref:TadE/TadG family type IV pilus assembly protein n=1 Tax=Aliivibrio fischeri TaxID=668 RepID=UPI0007C5B216|nr:TadE family protein [Aliivibrio fischeri]MBP3141076.1 pilus assembly protein [Aliivibrio fischeri]MBP3155627.1 pilus assembly protein [Aliivibrio fischeri]MCE7574181.1 pilus assembly protein [Aliivibrio fischeri]MUK43114.1 pilus assembly protein [Aliivibrio fischeri]